MRLCPNEDTILRTLETPVFIVGAPRSGTTWLQRLLLEDRRVVGGQESHFFCSFGHVVADFDRKRANPRPHGLAAYWRRRDLIEFVRDGWRRTMRAMVEAAPCGALLVEKTPEHTLWMEVIHEVLPLARFIHLVRDSRAVVSSLVAASREPWGEGWAPHSVRDAARRWNQYGAKADHFAETAGRERILIVRYEDLYADPARELARIYRFTGLEVTAEALAPIIERQAFGPQAASGGSPFHFLGDLSGRSAQEPAGFFRSGSPESWKRDLSIWQRWIIWWYTRQRMQRYGYERSGGRRPLEEPIRCALATQQTASL